MEKLKLLLADAKKEAAALHSATDPVIAHKRNTLNKVIGTIGVCEGFIEQIEAAEKKREEDRLAEIAAKRKEVAEHDAKTKTAPAPVAAATTTKSATADK